MEKPLFKLWRNNRRVGPFPEREEKDNGVTCWEVQQTSGVEDVGD
jgi:hypothetical protein